MMTTNENYLLLQLLRALKNQEIEVATWRTIASAALQVCNPAGTIPESEPVRIRAAVEPSISKLYLELEQALSDDIDVRQRLLDFALRHQ